MGNSNSEVFPRGNPGDKFVSFTISWIITIAATISGIVPLLLTPFIAGYAGGAFFSSLAWPGGGRKPFRVDLLLLTFTGFVGYVLISGVWSYNTATAINKAALVALLVAAVWLTKPLIEAMVKLEVYRAARGILSGVFIALIFVSTEYASRYTVLDYLAHRFPGFVKLENGAVPSFFLNNHASAMALFFWPTLLIAVNWHRNWQRWSLSAVVAVLIVATLVPTESATAQLAFIFALSGFLLAHAYPRAVQRALQVVWGLSVIVVVPLVFFLYSTGLQENKNVPESFRERVYIWHYTAERVFEHPLLGIGIRSSRYYRQTSDPVIGSDADIRFSDHLGWHSHNLYLQTWYELGAVGAAFMFVLGLFVLQRVGRLDGKVQPYFYAAFIGFATIAAFGYGMWQSWLLSAYAWCVIFLMIAQRFRSDQKTARQGV